MTRGRIGSAAEKFASEDRKRSTGKGRQGVDNDEFANVAGVHSDQRFLIAESRERAREEE